MDSNCLAYRAMMAMNGLEYNQMATGVVYGFLRYVLSIGEKFESNRFVFCWDSVRSYRRDLYSEYKAKRKREMSEEEEKIRAIGMPQFSSLRLVVLPRIGFFNVFLQTGVEADDLIAKITFSGSDREFIIVSSDNDLWQCIRNGVSQYNPATKKVYTITDFYDDWGFKPSYWPWVKAISGCSGDNVPGALGVGDKTAAKFLRGKLTQGKKLQSIQEFVNNNEDKQNMKLVRLPFWATKPVEFVPLWLEERNLQDFEQICFEYGLRSFLKPDYWKRWKAFYHM